jgi:hypothetical protein
MPRVTDWRRAAELAVLAVIGLAVATWVCLKVVLPSYVRRTFIELAEARGIALEIASVEVSLHTLTLVGVRASLPEVPDADATAAEVSVAMSGLSAEHVAARGVAVAIHGRFASVASGFARWRAAPRVAQNGNGTLQTASFDEAKIVWAGVLGDTTEAHAMAAHLDLAWPGRTALVRARSDEVTVTCSAGAFGPWGFDFEQAPGSLRVRATLDPGLPDAATLLVLGDGSSIATVDVAIPRQPLSRLGLASAWPGAKGLSTAIALHFSKMPGGRADLTTKGGLFGAVVTALEKPIDVRWDGAATGDPRTGIDLRAVALAVGPVVGDVRGKLTTFDDGFALDATWRGAPVPCAAFSLPLVSGEISEIAYQLRKLGPVGRLPGSVGGAASVRFDSRDLGATSATFKPEVTCPFRWTELR